MSRILVTGAAGFMGSHLAEALANEGHTVYGIDNLSIGIRENVPANIKFAVMDMTDADDMASVIEECKPEIIFHLAAWAHEGLSQFMPRLITENNYNAFMNLIVPAIRHGMKRIVVFSSMSVYGAQTPPFSETMPRQPEDIYAVAKSAMEYATEILADVHGFDYTIIRPHNVYGERQALHDPYRNVVAIFMNRVMKGLAPIIYGDGEQTRAFTYIADVIPYVIKAGFLEETKGEIINIGPLEEYTINRLAESVLKAFSRTDLVPEHIEDRPREVKHAYCTNDKAIALLGYKTSVSLDEGVGRMAEWAKKLGPQDFKYLEQLELEGSKIPETWTKKLI
jgi:UDP-glucose 4-epimerase